MNIKEKSFRERFVDNNSTFLIKAFEHGYDSCYEYHNGATHQMRLIAAEAYINTLVRVALNESATLEKALES